MLVRHYDYFSSDVLQSAVHSHVFGNGNADVKSAEEQILLLFAEKF